MKFRLPITI